MHELSVTRSILQILLRKAEEERLQRITRVFLVVGAMQDYQTEWMQRYFDRLSEGPPAQGAVIEVQRVPLRFGCQKCQTVFTLDLRGDAPLVCPQCGSEAYNMLSGREFYVDRIEAERMDEQEKTEETLNK